MIISEDYSQMAVKTAVQHEASGDWGNVDDDDLTFDYKPYDVTNDLKGNQSQSIIYQGVTFMLRDLLSEELSFPRSLFF